jgi:hypothetical protein
MVSATNGPLLWSGVMMETKGIFLQIGSGRILVSRNHFSQQRPGTEGLDLHLRDAGFELRPD